MGIAKVMGPNLVTTAGGLRVFRHNGLLSNWKRRGRGRRLDMVYLLGEAR